LIAFNLGKAYHELSGSVGAIDSKPKDPFSPLTFRIIGDGKELRRSNPLNKRGQSQSFMAKVSGVNKLELYVDCQPQISMLMVFGSTRF
jgi:hypothetical protein